MDTLFGFYATQPFWVWAGVAAAILAAEIATGSGWLLWASASAAATGVIASLAGPNFATALVVFAALTAVSTLLARRYLPRAAATGGDINDSVGRLTGQTAVAVGKFKGRSGRVMLDGKEWAAELSEGEGLEAGASVQVIAVDGARLTVRRPG